jgi:hypothetical protein
MIEYIKLISAFEKNKITAVKFQNQFLKLFKYDKNREVRFYELVEPLFWAVEDFCEYPELRDENDFDESQLKEFAVKTLFNITHSYKPMEKISVEILYDNSIKQNTNKKSQSINEKTIIVRLFEMTPTSSNSYLGIQNYG